MVRDTLLPVHRMFTGLIESTGTVISVEKLTEAARLVIEGGALTQDCRIGDSIAVDGVCLTMTQVEATQFTVLAVEETLRRTTLGQLQPGRRVNLELPLRPVSRLGGHFVQGHVDGRAVVAAITPEGEGVRVSFRTDRSLLRYLAEKGSVAVAGVSLTIAAASDKGFEVALIPHTRAVTTLGELSVGGEVNLEVDVLAKYVERLLPAVPEGAPLTEARLRELGY